MNPSGQPASPRERELFMQALEKPSREARDAFLDRACGNDSVLRRRLAKLLAQFDRIGAFLDQPVVSAEDRAGLAAAPNGEAGGGTVVLPVTEKPGDRIGRYKLLQEIGEGGCGVVYMAEQEEPVRRRVALKVIKLGMDTKSVIARFEAERQALALMDHPNIAKVLDAGATETGRPYFVMELVRGIKITEYCDQNNLSTRERLDLFSQVCHAIQHAHQKGIIHRDIKPSNILVSLLDGVPVPVVIDFGIARATEQRLTEKTLFTAFEQFMGTPAYTSPEQAEMSRLDIDTRSDIYSLGVLLYELLTGNTPFDPKTLLAAGIDEMRRTIREQEPVRPSTRLNTLSGDELTTTAKRRGTEAPKLIHLVRGDLDWIVMKCLEKDRRRRYETANGLAMDIERHLKHEPVVARPPSTVYRAQKFIRRNKVMVGAAGLVGAALVLGIAGSTWQAIRATRAGQREAEAHARVDQALRVAESEKQRAETEAQRAKESELTARQNFYVASMNLAQQAWEEDNVGNLRRLLQDTASYPDRGFEWYYWNRQAHLELLNLRGHRGTVVRVAFSPDGRRIATASDDRTAKVWDAGSGVELLTLRGHSAGLWWVAFSPDSQKLVTGSLDHTAKVWETSRGRELLTLKGHLAGIISTVFSPDGQRIATGSMDRTAKVWDVASGREVLQLDAHTDYVMSVAFSLDGRRLITGSADRTAKVWDLASSSEVLTLRGHTAGVHVATLSPDEKRILTCGVDATARVWDATTGETLLILQGHKINLGFAAFSPDGKRIVTGSFDQTAKVWDALSGDELWTLKGHGGAVTSVGLSPDGRRIITGSYDQTAKVWNAEDEQGPVTLKGHTNGICSVAFSSEGRRILTGSWDRTAKLWDAGSGDELLTIVGHSGAVTCAAFAPDDQRLVTVSSAESTARLWDAVHGRPLRVLTGHSGGIVSVGFSPDGHRIVTGGLDRSAKVWDANTGEELVSLRGHTGPVMSVAVCRDGSRIATASADQTARIWDAATGNPLLTLTGHSGGIRSVAFSPDGRRIITGSSDWTAKIWDAVSGKALLTLAGHKADVLCVAFSPDGQRVVTGGGIQDRTARIWGVASGRELWTCKDHLGWVSGVAFSPDGLRVVTGSSDRTAKVWEAASAAQTLRWLQEEQATAELLAAQDRERAAAMARDPLSTQEPGAIKQWLVLLPIAYEGSADRGLQAVQVPQELQLRPRAGEQVMLGPTQLVWRAVSLADSRLDFNALVGKVTEWSVAYAVAYIKSETAQSEVALTMDSSSPCSVWLNGKLIHRRLVTTSGWIPAQVAGGLELRPGINVLVFKVAGRIASWEGSVRLTDPDGNPLKGIQVTLDPADPD